MSRHFMRNPGPYRALRRESFTDRHPYLMSVVACLSVSIAAVALIYYLGV